MTDVKNDIKYVPAIGKEEDYEYDWRNTPEEFPPFEDIDTAADWNKSGDVMMVVPENAVGFNIDNKELAEVLVKIVSEDKYRLPNIPSPLNLQSGILKTPHGAIFLFRSENPKAYTNIALGYEVDMCLPGTCVLVRQDGVDRKWIKPFKNPLSLSKVPAYFAEDKKGKNFDFLNAKTKEERDSILLDFYYYMKSGLCREESRGIESFYDNLSEDDMKNIIVKVLRYFFDNMYDGFWNNLYDAIIQQKDMSYDESLNYRQKIVVEEKPKKEPKNTVKKTTTTPKRRRREYIPEDIDSETYDGYIEGFEQGCGRLHAGHAAIEVISKYHLIMIDGFCYQFNGKRYVPVYPSDRDPNIPKNKGIKILGQYIDRMNDSLHSSQIREITESIERKVTCLCTAVNPDPNVFNLNNGRYDLEKYCLTEHTPDIIELYCHDYDYIPWENISQEAKDFVNEFNKQLFGDDQELIDYAYSAAGSCLVRQKADKAFFLYGPKGTGKSTFLGLIQLILGVGNYCNVSFSDLGEGDNRFLTACYEKKLANLVDEEEPDMFSNKTAKIKSLITGGPLNVEHKNQDSFSINSYATEIHAINDNLKNVSGSLLDRVAVIPFYERIRSSSIEKADLIRTVVAKNPEYISAFFYLFVEGLKRWEGAGYKFDLLECPATRDAFKEFTGGLSGTGLGKWIESEESEEEFLKKHILKRKPADVYDSYMEFCPTVHKETVTEESLRNSLFNLFDLEVRACTVDKKTIKGYMFKTKK